jgi:glycosyltransferase involved in cell wall biosynthesis
MSTKKNKIEIVLFIKNEEELIESSILYHKQIADNITIIDNGSTDNTLNIINKYVSDNISLIIDNSSFENKGKICTKQIQDSDADIIVPLDADEFLLYDNSSIIKDNPKLIREYLQSTPIDGHKYKINKVYNKIENSNNYSIDKTYNSNKIIFPRLGFVETDCGFHFGKVILDYENPKINNIDISYLHLHYISKNRWLKSSTQKLKARLSEGFNNLTDIVMLASTKDKSNHIAKEMIYYLGTNKWHNLKHDVSFETPHLTSLLQCNIIPS